MAYYGIPSAGAALTASEGKDTIAMGNLGGTTLSAQSVYGAGGNDIISLASVGRTAIATVAFSGVGSGADDFSGQLDLTINGSAANTTGLPLQTSGDGVATSYTFTTAITSQQAARIANVSYLQGNAGEDSIALGASLTRISATTLAGGAGNDIIGGFTNVRNQWNAVNISADVLKSHIEGGLGNDTIQLNGDATYSALNVNANAGDDYVQMTSVSGVSTTIIGLGQGNDLMTGEFANISGSTVAGGKGNDTITLSGTNIESVIIGGDRANASTLDGDGADLIYVQSGSTNFSGSTIYGGGGNDTVILTADMTAVAVSLNKGADVYEVHSGGLINNSTIGLGQGDDIFDATGQMIGAASGRINLGKGNDSTYFGGRDLGSGGLFANSTIYGGAGADYIFGDATISGSTSGGITVEYQANSESTLSAFDTIAVDMAGSGTYNFHYAPGATGATFVSGAGASGSNGLILFSSQFASDVTARVEAIAAKASTGDAAAFVDGSNNAYLFVKGSTDNLVVQVGSAALSGAGDISSLGIADSNKTVTFVIEND